MLQEVCQVFRKSKLITCHSFQKVRLILWTLFIDFLTRVSGIFPEKWCRASEQIWKFVALLCRACWFCFVWFFSLWKLY